MKKLRNGLLLVVSILTLTACGNQSKSKDQTKSDQKQEINVTSGGSLTTLDSALYDDIYSSDNIGQMIEGLYRLDENNQPELGIAAEEPKISEDKTVYTFKLRDTKWSNGDPVVADDFVYAFQNVVDPAYGSQNADSMKDIKNAVKIANNQAPVDSLGVKAIDDKTLQITLERPVSYFKKLLTGTRFLPKDAKFAKAKGKAYGTSAKNVVANGPFVLEGWNGRNDTWKLVKNKNYWDAKNVKLDKVDVQVIKEVSTGVNLFDSGDTDFTVLTDEYAKQKQDSDDYHTVPKALVGYLSFNFKRKETANIHLRRAISQAFDKKAFTKNVLADGSTPLNGLVAAKFANNPETKKDFRKENGDLLSYNVKTAKKEWEKAKKELGKDKITLELLSADTSSAKKTVEYLQGELEQNLPGLKITVRSVPIGQRLEMNRAGNYDFFFGTWTPDYADPIDFLQPYTTNGGLNFGKFNNQKFDGLIEKANNDYASQPVKRWDTLLEAEKLMIQDQAVIAPVYQGAIAYLKNPQLKDLQTLPFGRSISYRMAYLAK